VRTGGQHGYYNICVLHRLSDRRRALGARADYLGDRSLRKVKRLNLTAADHLPRSHAATHIAKADKCDARHGALLLIFGSH
jgi:hypothetical protein